MNTRRFIVVMIIALALWNGVLTIGHYLSSAERGQILVGVFYYVWYGEERHWNEDQQSVVVDIPSTKYYRGYYSSLNRTVICQQLKLIEEAGIDFVIISWTGIDTYEDKATQLVFRVIQEENLDVKAAIMVEPTEYYGCKGDFCELNETRIAQAKSYILDKYVHPYKKQYFFWEDRPLLAFFVPLNPPKDLIFSTRVVGNREFGDWPYWTIPPIVSYDGVVAVLPRHDDSRLQRSNPIVKDEDYSARLYDQQWEFVLAMKDKVKAVLITTWNEYHERTMIEPHIDATVRILGYEPDYLYKKTQTYIKQLNLRPVLFAFIYAFPSQLLLFTILYYAVVCITKIGNEQAKENVKNIKQLLLVGAFSRMLVIFGGVLTNLIFGLRTPLVGETLVDYNVPILNLFSRWDSGYYLNIAIHGYTVLSSWAFRPLFPIMMSSINFALTASSPGAVENLIKIGFSFNNLLFLLSLMLFYRLGTRFLTTDGAFTASVLFAFYPTAFVMSAIYPEALFTVLMLIGYILLEDRRILASSLFALLAGLCRPEGITTSIIYILKAIQDRRNTARYLLGTFVTLLSMPVLLLYSFLCTGDFATPLKAELLWSKRSIIDMILDFGNLQLSVNPAVSIPYLILNMSVLCIISIGLISYYVRSIMMKVDCRGETGKAMFPYMFHSTLWFVFLVAVPEYLAFLRLSLFLYPVLWILSISCSKNKASLYSLLALNTLLMVLCTSLFVNWYHVT